jgi:RNA polymerase sigma-70 factor (ECF subfamily)
MMESTLLESRATMLGYIRRKVSDPDIAEDILHDSLLKALRSAPELRDEEKLIPWLYRIINNAITDFYRHRHVESRYMQRNPDDWEGSVEPEERSLICACIRDVIPLMKPEYAALIEELELSDEKESEAMAERLGITRNNLKVRRHRARTQLRERLEETCRACAKHGCLDCSCREKP